MTNKICNAGMATTCRYKRNAKPYTACVYPQPCVSEEKVTVESHGKKLVDLLEVIGWV